MPTLGRCGPYELERFIEAGGMGEIFLASGPTPRGHGPAAVKRMSAQAKTDPSFLEMFLDEGRVAQHLRHPGVCQVYDVGQADGVYYIAMEWVDGVSLEKLFRRAAGRGLVPQDVVARIGADVARALDYAHRAADPAGHPLGIVHRDVSPPNIMIGLDGRVKLLDFGLAKARTQLARTQPGYVKGKFGYLAPEQLGGQVDGRADVFALGLCLYEALSGRQVFVQETAAETVVAITQYQGVPRVGADRSDVWPDLEAAVAKASQPSPMDRYSTAGELGDALESSLGAHGVTADTARVAGVVAELFPERKRRTASRDAPTASAPDARDPLGLEEMTEALEARRRQRWIAAAIATVLALVSVAVAVWAFRGV